MQSAALPSCLTACPRLCPLPSNLAALCCTFCRTFVPSQPLTFLSLSPPQALLCRYSGQEEVVVGVPVAGRDRPETHPIIGYFINSVPILGGLGDTSGGDGEGPTLAAMARAASQALTDALAHSLLPLTQLAAAVRAERILGANPVFQVRAAGGECLWVLVLLWCLVFGGCWRAWWVLQWLIGSMGAGCSVGAAVAGLSGARPAEPFAAAFHAVCSTQPAARSRCAALLS